MGKTTGRRRPTGVLHELLRALSAQEGVLWRRQNVPANHTIFSAGDSGQTVYLVVSGTVRVVGNVDLDELKHISPGFSDLGPGEIFGEVALFDGRPRSAAVIAVTDCELAVIEGAALMQYLDSHPDIGYPIFKELIKMLVGRLRITNQRLFSLFAWGLRQHGIDKHL